MIIVTDAVTKNTVFIAPQHVVAVFEIPEGDHAGKTGVNLINGSIVCEEDMLTIKSAVANSSGGCCK
jgi:hypothetical protein